ncbi:hypothetical protein ACJRO7_016098 [Eucalyptus globulus]|uniref:Uncharacterized protein n=1 Tax=Eucalyptus globulus TaxID=34317 RepID=A0ABD3L9M6_EUCGL
MLWKLHNFAFVTPFSCPQVVNAAAIVDPLSNQAIAGACDEVCSRQTPKTEVGAECSSSTKSSAEMTRWTKHESCLQRCSSGGAEQVKTSISCLYPRWWVDEQTGRSSSFWHPLRHAAMVAIESSAARDRRLFPDVRYKDEATKEKFILPLQSLKQKDGKLMATTYAFPLHVKEILASLSSMTMAYKYHLLICYKVHHLFSTFV